MPVAAVLDTVMVYFEVPEPGAAIDVGLKLPVTPVGKLDADKATAASKPPETAVVMTTLPLLLSSMDTEVGETEMVKAGGGSAVTVSVILAV